MDDEWSVIWKGDHPIQVTLSDGSTVTVHPGETVISTPSACEMLDFLQRRNPDIPLTETTNGWYMALLAAGQNDGCVGLDDEINVTPNVGTSTTPPPMPPPADGDSAQGQGAPTVTPGLQLDSAGTDARGTVMAPGQGDTRPPEEEPRDHPSGQPDSNHGGASPQQCTMGGDPIDLFAGAFTIDETDLTLETAALPLEMTRIYRSGRAYCGPFGWGWDHNHNCYLRELEDGSVARWTGRLHEDRFMPNGPTFEPPRGVFEVLERLPGPATRYLIAAPGGEEREFAQPAGWPLAERIPLVVRRDRHGNRQTYTYNAVGQLAEVRDDEQPRRGLRLRLSGQRVVTRQCPGCADHARMTACSCTMGCSALRVVQAALSRVMACREVAQEIRKWGSLVLLLCRGRVVGSSRTAAARHPEVLRDH